MSDQNYAVYKLRLSAVLMYNMQLDNLIDPTRNLENCICLKLIYA